MQELFMRFPLPLLVVNKNNQPIRHNPSFERAFPPACTDATSWQTFLQSATQPGEEPQLFYSSACQANIFVRHMPMGENTVLILEKTSGSPQDNAVHQLQKRIHELERSNASDPLTGTWNRAHFQHVIHIELERSLRYHQPISLIFFDIDHFKRVNDTYGHACGDNVLCELVNVVRRNIRASDMLFRWGGEEFALLATSTHYRAASKLANSLRSKVAAHPMPNVGHITISLGVAEFFGGESEEDWFNRADQALYQAKGSGRNRVVIDPRGSSDLWANDADDSRTIMRMVWHDSYLCGHPLIDAQHQRLFDLSNELLDTLFQRADNPLAFELALDNLLAHVAQHFANEEAILAERHYPDLATHAQAHRRLLERAMQLKQASQDGSLSGGELVDFLADEVVARHMQRMDRQFYPLFNT